MTFRNIFTHLHNMSKKIARKQLQYMGKQKIDKNISVCCMLLVLHYPGVKRVIRLSKYFNSIIKISKLLVMMS